MGRWGLWRTREHWAPQRDGSGPWQCGRKGKPGCQTSSLAGPGRTANCSSEPEFEN